MQDLRAYFAQQLHAHGFVEQSHQGVEPLIGLQRGAGRIREHFPGGRDDFVFSAQIRLFKLNPRYDGLWDGVFGRGALLKNQPGIKGVTVLTTLRQFETDRPLGPNQMLQMVIAALCPGRCSRWHDKLDLYRLIFHLHTPQIIDMQFDTDISVHAGVVLS